MAKAAKKTRKKKQRSSRDDTGQDLASLDQLNPAPYNPRTIAPEAAAGLAASIRRFGDLSGITWNKRTGNLVTGHQRFKQLRGEWGKDLQFDGASIVTPDGSTWPVRVVDWHLTKEKAANIAANNTHIQGGFDDDALAVLLVDVKEDDGDLYSSVLLAKLEAAPTKGMEEPDASPQLDGMSFRVLVTCRDEEDQAALIRRLERESYACTPQML